MNLKQTRLITNDLPRLTHFYESVTGAAATPVTGTYVEFRHALCDGLAIADVTALRAYGENIAEAARNRSRILDFEVDDVDAEYDRLKAEVSDWVQQPKTMPWGNRAMLFRDPDGNLINIFATIHQTADA
jgi:catechol 2,3-dioxygenase-like lactoylglutathione lyase family enzyme